MKQIIFDCTDYMQELVTRKEVPDNCLMYSKGYLLRFINNDEVHIYRIQINMDAEYEYNKGVTIVELMIYTMSDILYESPLYSDSYKEIFDPMNSYSISMRDIIKQIIIFDECKGFECFKITQYRKYTDIESIFDEMRYDSVIVKF